MTQKDLKRIQEALDILADEGRKSYKPECQADVKKYEAVGMAIAHATNSAREVLRLAYAALEDWNYHDLCAVIEWVHPLFNQTFHVRDLQRLERMLNKQGVTVFTEWDDSIAGYKTKVVNVRLAIEDANEDE